LFSTTNSEGLAMTVYLPDSHYDRLIEALANPRLSLLNGIPTPADAVKVALGEIGDVWPESIKADCEDDEES
jgi:hypothetical protein